jgi:biopolymer transport protein TolQ
LNIANGLLLQGSFSNLWALISNTGIVGQFVLLILVFFSVLSWTIMIQKFRLFREVRAQSGEFHADFSHSQSFSELYGNCDRFPMSPLAGIFKVAFQELDHQVTETDESDAANPTISSLASFERTLRRAAAVEMTSLEKSLNWLATTGAITPFIGLFGTVVGIINAFQGLGEGMTTTIQAVAPGISEALVATAAGLFAAIPAVIGYNHFLSDLKVFGTEMDDFSAELLSLVERSFGPANRQN